MKDLSIKMKIRLILAMVILSFSFIISLNIYQFYNSLLTSKEKGAENAVKIAASLLEEYIQQVKDGKMSESAAKQEAIKKIRTLSYGDDKKDYFWINDQTSMIMHPIQPELDGTSLDKILDNNGRAFLFDMNKSAFSKGSCFYAYKWPKPGFNKPIDKISFLYLIKDWGWVIGSGVYIDDIQTLFFNNIIQDIAIAIVVLLILIYCVLFVEKSIHQPILIVTKTMLDLADGKNVNITLAETKNEIGEMVKSLKYFQQRSSVTKSLEDKLKISQLHEAQNHELENLSDKLESDITEIIVDFSMAAKSLVDESEQMIEVAKNANEKSHQSSEISNFTAQNFQTMAAAAEELIASIGEISLQMNKSTDVSSKTLEKASNADVTVNSLINATNEISSVIEMIEDITKQINLLALNATIEAARAGEAGKGFSVVASEVKNLANETSKSTGNIIDRVANIKKVSQRVTEDLSNIKIHIKEFSEYSIRVMGAVGEQEIATQEISKNIHVANSGIQDINYNTNICTDSINKLSDSASRFNEDSKLLITMADNIIQTVKKYLDETRIHKKTN